MTDMTETANCRCCSVMERELQELRLAVGHFALRHAAEADDALSATATAALTSQEISALLQQRFREQSLTLQEALDRAARAETAADSFQVQMQTMNGHIAAMEAREAGLLETIERLMLAPQPREPSNSMLSRHVSCDVWTQTILSESDPTNTDTLPKQPPVSAASKQHFTAAELGRSESPHGLSRSVTQSRRGTSSPSPSNEITWSHNDAAREQERLGSTCSDAAVKDGAEVSRGPSPNPAGAASTPIRTLSLQLRPRLLDGVRMDDVWWPAAEASSVANEPTAAGVNLHDDAPKGTCALRSVSRELSVGTARGKSPSVVRIGGQRTPRLHLHGGPRSESRTGTPVCVSTSRNGAVSTIAERRAGGPSSEWALSSNVKSCRAFVWPVHETARKRVLPSEAEELYATAAEGLHLLRGLTVRADKKMFVTMSNVHELNDCGCPLKTALVRIKQSLLGALPSSVHAKIRDGERWLLQKRDLMNLTADQAPTLSKALRELIIAHDYLRSMKRSEAMASVTELYLNIHIFVILARSPAVQGQFVC